MKTIDLLDTFTQEIVPHTLEVDASGDIVATSTVSDHFVKFPAFVQVPINPDSKKEIEFEMVATDKKMFAKMVAKHNEHNLGQVSAEAEAAKNDASWALVDKVATGEHQES